MKLRTRLGNFLPLRDKLISRKPGEIVMIVYIVVGVETQSLKIRKRDNKIFCISTLNNRVLYLKGSCIQGVNLGKENGVLYLRGSCIQGGLVYECLRYGIFMPLKATYDDTRSMSMLSDVIRCNM